MSSTLPVVGRAREVLSRRLGCVVSCEETREAVENLVGLFQLLREWDRKARGEFETSGRRGVAGVPAPAYAPAASGPRRAAR
jgi:hypothetical protein